MRADILGLDLSLTGTGWATLDVALLSTGRITTRTNGCQRIDYVQSQIAPLCDARLVAIEGPSYASNLAFSHEGAGLWWQVRMWLWHSGHNVVVITPSSLKKYATGKGNAEKPAVLAEASRRFPDVRINTTDEADALWMVAMCAERYGRPLVDMPAVNRSAIYATVKPKGKPAHPAIDWPNLNLWEPAHA